MGIRSVPGVAMRLQSWSGRAGETVIDGVDSIPIATWSLDLTIDANEVKVWRGSFHPRRSAGPILNGLQTTTIVFVDDTSPLIRWTGEVLVDSVSTFTGMGPL